MPKGNTEQKTHGRMQVLVVETMQKERQSYSEAARWFEISDHKRVAVWEQIYLTEEAKGFAIEWRGRWQ